MPEKAAARLRALTDAHERHEAPSFNHPDKFGAFTAEAVAAQRHAIAKLAHPSTWSDAHGTDVERARAMHRAAAYCRRAGYADVANTLQRLAATLAAGKGSLRAWRPGGSTMLGAHLAPTLA